MTIRFKLKLKDCEEVFSEELGEGVLVMEEIEFDVTEEQKKLAVFANAINGVAEKFVERHVEVIKEVVEE